MDYCSTCHAPLPEYAALIAIARCLPCAALERQRAGRGRPLMITETLGHFNGATRKPRGPNGTEVAREHAERAILAWCAKRGNKLPLTEHFGRNDGLPSINVIRRCWGSLLTMRRALRRAHPHLILEEGIHWNAAKVEQAVSVWIAAHRGRIPIVEDFKRDKTLPVPSVIYTHFGGGLNRFYAEFMRGQYAQRYAEIVKESLRKAGRAGGKRRREKRKVSQPPLRSGGRNFSEDS